MFILWQSRHFLYHDRKQEQNTNRRLLSHLPALLAVLQNEINPFIILHTGSQIYFHKHQSRPFGHFFPWMPSPPPPHHILYRPWWTQMTPVQVVNGARGWGRGWTWAMVQIETSLTSHTQPLSQTPHNPSQDRTPCVWLLLTQKILNMPFSTQRHSLALFNTELLQNTWPTQFVGSWNAELSPVPNSRWLPITLNKNL